MHTRNSQLLACLLKFDIYNMIIFLIVLFCLVSLKIFLSILLIRTRIGIPLIEIEDGYNKRDRLV